MILKAHTQESATNTPPTPMYLTHLLLTDTAVAGGCAGHTRGGEARDTSCAVLVTSHGFERANWTGQAGKGVIRRVETLDTVGCERKKREKQNY